MQTKLCRILVATVALWTIISISAYAKENSAMQNQWIYFGTQAGVFTEAMHEASVPPSDGLYVGRYHASDAKVTDIRLAAKMKSSGFFTIVPDRKMLYVAGSRVEDGPGTNVYAFRIEPKDGSLTYVNHKPSGGKGATHIHHSPDGQFVAVANYSSGDFAVFKVGADGSVGEMTALYAKPGKGPNTRRQDSSKGHSVYFVEHKGEYRVFMVDLGADRVLVAKLDRKTGKLTDDPEAPRLECPPGSGPRHMAWSEAPDGSLCVYVINELDSTLSVFRLRFGQGAKNAVTYLGSPSTLPKAFRKGLVDDATLFDGKKYLFANKTAEVEFRSFGDRDVVYASNRGDNTVAVFDVTSLREKDGKNEAKMIQRQPTFGTFPRFFTTDPAGRFLIVSNKRTGTIYTMNVNQKNGKLTPVNRDPLRISYVICIGFFPMGAER